MKQIRMILVLLLLLPFLHCSNVKKEVQSSDINKEQLDDVSKQENLLKKVCKSYKVREKKLGRVIQDIDLPEDKIEYIVEIYDRYELEDLDLIADELKQLTPSKHPYVFISFYTHDQVIGNISYALSIRTPQDKRSQINIAKKSDIDSNVIKLPNNILGKWEFPNIGVIVIYKKNNSIFLFTVFQNQKTDDHMRQLPINKWGRKLYHEEGNMYEFWRIADNGNLIYYDDLGNKGLELVPLKE